MTGESESEMVPCAPAISNVIAINEWDTKEDTGKSMKNVLYVLRYAKRHLSG